MTALWPSPGEPVAVARRYMQAHTLDGLPLLHRWRGTWMRWEQTRWAEQDDAAVRAGLYAALEHARYIDQAKKTGPAEMPWQPNKRRIADVLDALDAITHLPETTSPPAWHAMERDKTHCSPYEETGDASHIVACRNGLLDVTTRTLAPHTPALFNLVSVPFDYHADATAPKWLQFLTDLWPDDPDSIAALQQFTGYLLSGRTDLHKILLIIGPTRAGKGTIARIITMLLGASNVAGPTLASLSSNFGLAPLIGKPLAIVSDARLAGSSTQVVERLLSISGEDALTIDRKFRDPWTGKLPTRFIVMSNELPSFGDASGAIARRFAVLVLRRSWLGAENTSLTAELATELPGILNWALDGLAALTESGRLTAPKSSDDAIVALLDQASPISAFVRECCETGAYEVPVDDLYAAWKAWCEDNGRDRPGNKQIFGRNLSAVVPGLRRSQPRTSEPGTDQVARTRTYVGIRLKESRYTHNGFDRVPSRAATLCAACGDPMTTITPGQQYHPPCEPESWPAGSNGSRAQTGAHA